MMVARPTAATALADGTEALRELLGDGFEVRAYEPPTAGRGDDAVLQITAQRGGIHTDVLVDAVADLSPTDADRLLRPRVELLRRVQSRANLLVMAPWLSPRTRTTLDELGVNYLDLTGNVRLDVPQPRVLIRTDGAARDPWPRATGDSRSLAGPRAGRLVRWLVDHPPPYRVSELAASTQLSAGYVSRLVDVVEDLGLLRREGRRIVDVDWVGLLRERASRTDLLRANSPVSMLAPRGVPDLLDRLAADDALRDEVTVTGSVAAAAYAPLAVGGQLLLYVPAAYEPVAEAAGLLRTDEGANVLLLVPGDPGVRVGRREVDGLWHVAPSQLALDCLSGPGRLPAAGEEVLRRMIDTRAGWRIAD